MCLHNIPINPYAWQEQLRHNDQEQVTFTSKVNVSKSKYVLDKKVLKEAIPRKSPGDANVQNTVPERNQEEPRLEGYEYDLQMTQNLEHLNYKIHGLLSSCRIPKERDLGLVVVAYIHTYFILSR